MNRKRSGSGGSGELSSKSLNTTLTSGTTPSTLLSSPIPSGGLISTGTQNKSAVPLLLTTVTPVNTPTPVLSQTGRSRSNSQESVSLLGTNSIPGLPLSIPSGAESGSSINSGTVDSSVVIISSKRRRVSSNPPAPSSGLLSGGLLSEPLVSGNQEKSTPETINLLSAKFPVGNILGVSPLLSEPSNVLSVQQTISGSSAPKRLLGSLSTETPIQNLLLQQTREGSLLTDNLHASTDMKNLEPVVSTPYVSASPIIPISILPTPGSPTEPIVETVMTNSSISSESLIPNPDLNQHIEKEIQSELNNSGEQIDSKNHEEIESNLPHSIDKPKIEEKETEHVQVSESDEKEQIADTVSSPTESEVMSEEKEVISNSISIPNSSDIISNTSPFTPVSIPSPTSTSTPVSVPSGATSTSTPTPTPTSTILASTPRTEQITQEISIRKVAGLALSVSLLFGVVFLIYRRRR